MLALGRGGLSASIDGNGFLKKPQHGAGQPFGLIPVIYVAARQTDHLSMEVGGQRLRRPPVRFV